MPRRLTLPLARFIAALPVVVRPCAAADLPLLEWHGAFTHHRELIAATFERQRRAECVMLLADVGGFRLGYRIAGRVRETYAYTPPGGTREEVRIEEVLLRKRIRTAAAARARTVGGIAEVRP